MKIDIKSPRANKRKLVIPFAGEENFIIQKNNDEYISVSNDSRYSNLNTPLVGQGEPPPTEPPIGQGLPSGTGGINTNPENPNYNTGNPLGGLSSGSGTTGASTGNSTLMCEDGSTPRNGICPPPRCLVGEISVNGVCVPSTTGGGVVTCGANEQLVNGVCVPLGGGTGVSVCGANERYVNGYCVPITPNPPTCASGEQLVNGVCVAIVTPPTDTTGGGRNTGNTGDVITTIPTFPDYSTMNCANLTEAISSLTFQISSGGFNLEVANAYNNALATAKNTYSSKCNTPTPSTPSPSIAIIPSTGGFMGGGGSGGLGEPPADTNITEETINTNQGLSWFWIVAILGGLYFLTKGNK